MKDYLAVTRAELDAQRTYSVPYVPVGAPLSQVEIDTLNDYLTLGSGLSCGAQRDAFEFELADFFGGLHVVSLANCTHALEIATHLAGIGKGDEVLASPLSYQANIAALLSIGAKVKFCDVDPNTLNISPESVASMISRNTKAVYLVHYGGMPADMTNISSIAHENGAVLIEDCAHAVGTIYQGRSVGRYGLGCWSFQSYKNISTLGEGGALTTIDASLAARAAKIRSIEPDAQFRTTADLNFGKLPYLGRIEWHEKNSFEEDCVEIIHGGTNSTLPEVAALIGRMQLARVDQLIGRRREIANMFSSSLGSLPGVRLQSEPAGCLSSFHLYTIFLDSAKLRAAVMGSLLEAGVQVQQRYFPLHRLPEWRHAVPEASCPIAESSYWEHLLNIPIYPQLTESQIGIILDAFARGLYV